MAFNTSAFQEPRGVMRIIQFIFAICAFATTSGFSNTLKMGFCDPQNLQEYTFEYDYPFRLDRVSGQVKCGNESATEVNLYGDFSSDSQFFVATGVLSFLYCIGICVVYTLFDQMYQTNVLVPMADFILTVLLAIFWLSGSAAWSNGLSGLKSLTDPSVVMEFAYCKSLKCSYIINGSFSTLNVSAILGFLNFFLWASDLWFLYKETPWFKSQLPTNPSSPGAMA